MWILSLPNALRSRSLACDGTRQAMDSCVGSGSTADVVGLQACKPLLVDDPYLWHVLIRNLVAKTTSLAHTACAWNLA